MAIYRKKLIEVALPLAAINRAAAKEKSIRHGHPSTLHLWWARRPLAAARAVIFASLVDDPSSVPEEFPTQADQDAERRKLFKLIEDLVMWKNTTNEELLRDAQAEIRKSWARWCRESGEDPDTLPPFHDPFAGGGSLPLEAQRLGLEAHASDLNPVAVMINKAMIEIPPRFADMAPVNPKIRKKIDGATNWQGATGLAEDVRYYGAWMRTEAQKRIGHLYPKIAVVQTKDGSFRHATEAEIRDGKSGIQNRTVIAWLWARTVASPNPAFGGVHVPLIASFWLSTKKNKETWIEPVIAGKTYRFAVRTGEPEDKKRIGTGTKLGRGANFRCVLSNSPISPAYIKAEGMAGRMGARLMAIVVQGDWGRVYLEPTEAHEEIARQAKPTWGPDQDMPKNPRWFSPPDYGLPQFSDLFTPRQLTALTAFADLVAEAREQVCADGIEAWTSRTPSQDDSPLADGGTGAVAYAEAVSVYLGIGVSKLTDYNSSIVLWSPQRDQAKATFSRQALPMVWDFAEVNPFASAAGDLEVSLSGISKTLEQMPASQSGGANQWDAAQGTSIKPKIISTDPPYYDNIGYADLSDFFYVWMRRSLQSVYPELFGTLLVPKAEELVATPYRHGSRDAAEKFFLDGMTRAMHAMAERAHPAFPVTIYYAFKQSEKKADGVFSTGWETFLEAIIKSGLSLTGTWPMRTERAVRSVGIGTNALASSIVLVCRPRAADAALTSRRDFISALRRELPPALRQLQQGNIAPVDLAQASIGPGMAIFSRFGKILEADGSAMRVRTALSLINQILDEVLAEQEGDFDKETGWAVAWFEQFGFNDGPFGEAETLFTAKNTALDALKKAGIVRAGAGKVRLVRLDELPEDWDPLTDKRLTVWEMVHHLIRVLKIGELATAELLAKLGAAGESARELAYRLYSICERRQRSAEALDYNALVLSWPEIVRLAQEYEAAHKPKQTQWT
jgi:putative DNA methylase